jgi:hypothetical protein
MNQERMTRKRLIRRRVVGAAVALFMAVWLVIAVTLASGHDPALSSSAHVRRAATNAGTKATSSPASTASSSTVSAPSPVITQQS